MRYALIVAPWDPRLPDARIWSEGVAWLGAALSRLDFRVAVVDGEHYTCELVTALEDVPADAALLVHVSGRLAARAVLRTPRGRLPFRLLGDAIAERGIAAVSVFAELVHGEDRPDGPTADEHAAAVVDAMEASARGFGVVVAVRSTRAPAPAEGLPFTRLFLREAASARPEVGHLSTIYACVAQSALGRAAASGFAHLPGALDLALAPRAPTPSELDRRLAEAVAARDWAAALHLRRERLAGHTAAPARVQELVSIARLLQTEFADPDGAILALEAARAIDPRSVQVLQALRRSYERRERWPDAIATAGALADLAETPADRAELRFAEARMAFEHSEDYAQVVEWLEGILKDDPSHERARSMMSAVLSSRPPPEGTPVDERATATADAPDAGRASPIGREAEAERAVLDPRPHARAFAGHRREGRTDCAFLTAMVLEELDAADAGALELLHLLRTPGPIRARAMLDADAWSALRAPGSDEVFEALFGTVARAAVAVRIEQLAERSRLCVPEPATRIAESSGALVPRIVRWAARVLGVRCPALYSLDPLDALGVLDGEMAALHADRASIGVSSTLESSRSPKELAFLAGRTMSYFRPEHEVLVYYPTRGELTRLFFAAVQLVKPSASPREGARAVGALRARLDRTVTDLERGVIFQTVRRLEERGGRGSLGAWMRSVEHTAIRAGLLLSGDLAPAMAVLRSEARRAAALAEGTSAIAAAERASAAENKRCDLLAFCESEAHARLRELYVMPARASAKGEASVAPPPPDSAESLTPQGGRAAERLARAGRERRGSIG
jgi:hypothetical protein